MLSVISCSYKERNSGFFKIGYYNDIYYTPKGEATKVNITIPKIN